MADRNARKTRQSRHRATGFRRRQIQIARVIPRQESIARQSRWATPYAYTAAGFWPEWRPPPAHSHWVVFCAGQAAVQPSAPGTLRHRARGGCDDGKPLFRSLLGLGPRSRRQAGRPFVVARPAEDGRAHDRARLLSNDFQTHPALRPGPRWRAFGDHRRARISHGYAIAPTVTMRTAGRVGLARRWSTTGSDLSVAF